MDRIKEVRSFLPARTCAFPSRLTQQPNSHQTPAAPCDAVVQFCSVSSRLYPKSFDSDLYDPRYTPSPLISMASKLGANFQQKMNSLRLEADDNAKQAEEYREKLKATQQQVLDLENQNKSLTHRNGLLQAEVDKLEQGVKEAKDLSDKSAQHGQQNEALTRRLQLLEEEAESADKTLRETNDKFVEHLRTS